MRTKQPLIEAKRVKADEFYTPIELIEKEVPYYKDSLKGKVVYCNCDDYRVSAFYTYFVSHFEDYDLEAVISTSYDPDGYGTYAIYDGEEHVSQLQDNGDFRGDSCKEILRTSDVVITNPPFSLFRDFISVMMEYNKQFLVVGNQNAVSHKNIFPYIKNQEIVLGPSIHSCYRLFYIPDEVDNNNAAYGGVVNGRKYIKVNGVRWFTNMSHGVKTLPLIMTATYEEGKYPKYDNCDAIDVSKVRDIPCDYYGVMGVPVTFIDKWCPEQFKILGVKKGDDGKYLSINGKMPYTRILIQRL